MVRIVVIGGGAAGFMSAIVCAESVGKKAQIIILERGRHVLEKVKISGGGRCNVTHNCPDPKDLVKNYPRGERELLGPFMQFNCTHTIEWFLKRGVKLKAESDGRMFPITDSSETIVNCLINTAQKHQIQISTNTRVDQFLLDETGWKVKVGRTTYHADYLICTPGSSSSVWENIRTLGHTVIAPVPSLFTFNIKHPIIEGLLGVSVRSVQITCKRLNLKSAGPLLITHWGLSGPAILKLSAWGARKFNEVAYNFEITVNWTNDFGVEAVIDLLVQQKGHSNKQKVHNTPLFDLSSRLWESICRFSGITEEKWADLSKQQLRQLALNLAECPLQVKGKSTFKEEFVTAGGVSLKEINMKTMESKLFPNLYLAGEVIDVDAVTGGFNFQAAWTEGWLIGKAIGEKASVIR